VSGHDVGHPHTPGRQLRTILWLRWRLTRNQWAKGGGLGAALAGAGVAVGVALAVLGFTGGLAGGRLGLHDAPSFVVMLIWLGVSALFLLVWVMVVLTDLQRSEPIDIQRLMHLPVALGQAFAVNYLASVAGLTIAFFAPAMVGLALGLALDRGPSMLLLVPLSMGLLFMSTAWTYVFQGWIATWIQSPRRRRAVITAITLSVVLAIQLPNLIFNVFGRHDPPRGHAAAAVDPAREDQGRRVLEGLMLAEKIVPPLWLAGGAAGLADGDPLVALLGTIGFAALGALGLSRGYRSTLRFYAGSGGGGGSAIAAAAPAKGPASPSPATRQLVERRPPGVPEQAAAVATATLRSMLRAPEIMMGVGAALVILIVVSGGMLVRFGGGLGPHFGPLIVAGGMSLTNLMLAQLSTNQFGYDRDGLRALMLAPIARDRVLLGKNLAVMAFATPPCTILIAVSAAWLRLPPLAVVAALLQMASMLLIAATVGNLLSILLPYRIRAGSMKATKLPAGAMLALIGCQFGLPALCAPAFAGPLAVLFGHSAHWKHPVVLDFVLSLAVAAAAAGAYAACLGPLGRLLQRRETLILAQVAVEQE
jgi:ABC-2 type transport system permease protein